MNSCVYTLLFSIIFPFAAARKSAWPNERSLAGIKLGGVILGLYSKWGSWGLLEYHDQDVKAVPKYQAVLNFIEQNPAW